MNIGDIVVVDTDPEFNNGQDRAPAIVIALGTDKDDDGTEREFGIVRVLYGNPQLDRVEQYLPDDDQAEAQPAAQPSNTAQASTQPAPATEPAPAATSEPAAPVADAAPDAAQLTGQTGQ